MYGELGSYSGPMPMACFMSGCPTRVVPYRGQDSILQSQLHPTNPSQPKSMYISPEIARGAHLDDPVWTSDTSSLQFASNEIGWQALGPAIVCTALSTFVVVLRWYTRWRLVKCVGLDDCIVLLSLILAWAVCIVIGLEYNEGLGSHQSSEVDSPHLAKLVVINNNLWSLTVNITKASILIQYLRIFGSPRTRILCFALMSLLLPAACWSIFAGTFLCRPVTKLWDPEVTGHCMDPQTYWLSTAIINTCLDFLILSLPLPSVFSLQLPRKQKLCLVTLFSLGFFTCIVSIVRLVTVHVEAEKGNIVKSGIFAVLWSAIEANVGIICASLLALKPLLSACFPRLLDETSIPAHSMRLPEMQANHLEHCDSAATLVATPSAPLEPKRPNTDAR